MEKKKRAVHRLDKLSDNITFQEMLFVREFVIDFCAKQAAIRAGYKPGYAEHASERLLTRENVRAAIAKQLQDRTKRLQITAEMVVEEFAKVAFSTIADIAEWDENGTLTYKASADIPPAVMAAIAEVSIVPTDNGPAVKIKMHSKNDALNSLAKHLGIMNITHKHEHSGPGGDPIKYQQLPTEHLASIAQKLLEHKEANKN